MSCRHDNVGMGDWGRMDTGHNQTGNVGNVGDKIGTDLIGDLAESFKINNSRIGSETADNYFGLLGSRQFFDLTII